MATELSNVATAEGSGVLPPTIERRAIRIAVDEFRISERRANQLLSFAARQNGLRQISAADAKAKLRAWIAGRLNSRESQASELVSEISGLADRFGISNPEVEELIQAEVAARQSQRQLGKRWLLRGSLVAACFVIAAYFLSPALRLPSTSQPSKVLGRTETKPDSNLLPQKLLAKRRWWIRERPKPRTAARFRHPD